MKSLIIDDEASARSRLTRLLSAHTQVEIVGEAHDGLQAVERIEQLRPELIFLDVQMPGLNGFQVLQALSASTAAAAAAVMPLVIFVTGFDEHALAAFEANALAYLLKPVEDERLAQAIERAQRLHAYASQRAEEGNRIEKVIKSAPLQLRQIVGRKHGRLMLLQPTEVFFFQVEDSIVKAHTAEDSYWVNYQLNDLEEGLPESVFFRARRSVIVNLMKVREIKPYFKSSFLLTMSDSVHTEIQVSERQAKLLRHRLPGL